MGSLTLRVITPEEIVLDVQTASVQVPATDGGIGILPRHAPMVAALGVGELDWHGSSGATESMFIAGGFAEVRDDTVRVVTEASERPEDIDIERARGAAERARSRLKEAAHDRAAAVDALRAEASLRRALMRMRVAGKKR